MQSRNFPRNGRRSSRRASLRPERSSHPSARWWSSSTLQQQNNLLVHYNSVKSSPCMVTTVIGYMTKRDQTGQSGNKSERRKILHHTRNQKILAAKKLMLLK